MTTIYGFKPDGSEVGLQLDADGRLITASSDGSGLSTIDSFANVSVGATATELAVADTDRGKLLITNTHSSDLFVAPANTVTSSLYAYLLPQGFTLEVPDDLATFTWYGIRASETGDASVLEVS